MGQQVYLQELTEVVNYDEIVLAVPGEDAGPYLLPWMGGNTVG